MRVVCGSAGLGAPPERSVLTVGNFDGLHLGHRAILRTLTDRVRALSGTAVVYTFDPHPLKVLRRETAPRLLLTMDQKIELLGAAGIDLTVIESFSPDFARMAPREFLCGHLYRQLKPVEIYVGHDFHYGRDRRGSRLLLEELSAELGFALTVVPEVTQGGRGVSSTRIRDLLRRGAVEEAAQLLGRPYAMWGRVALGDQRGRDLGFPTLNLAPESELLPARGVYASHVRLLDDGAPPAGARFGAVTNVGRRPTFKRDDPALAEAHLLDFRGDLYGRRFELSFLARLREERRFPGPEALREQIQRDLQAGRRLLTHPPAAPGGSRGGAGRP